MELKKYFKYALMLAICFLVATSCNKYLDIQPKGKTLLLTVTDYDQWLSSTDVEASEPVELNQFGDNQDNITLTNPPTGTSVLAYLWYPQFSPDPTSSPVIWGPHYKSIYYFNTVLRGIDAATGGTAQQKASLKAEALLGRALEYLSLVNEYGKPYNSATA